MASVPFSWMWKDPALIADQLLGMRERVEIIGGTFCVASVPGQHTTVLVEIPADKNDAMNSLSS